MASQIKCGSYVALVDDADLPMLACITWTSSSNRGCRYAISAGFIGGKKVPMHRLIIGATDGQDVDHINGNGLDNRRENLRVCSRSQNLQNSRKHCGGHSKFKGVQKVTRRNAWSVRIAVNKRRIWGGYFTSEEDAAHRYDELAREHFGEYCRVNFPREGELCALSN